MLETIKKCYGRFIELIPYVSIGLLFAMISDRFKSKNIFLILAIVAFITNLLTVNIPKPFGFNFSGVQILTSSVFVFSSCLALSQLKFNSLINSIIEILGRYSFGIYLFHFTLIEAIVRINPFLKQFALNHSILFLAFTMTLSYILCIIFNILTRRKFVYLVE